MIWSSLLYTISHLRAHASILTRQVSITIQLASKSLRLTLLMSFLIFIIFYRLICKVLLVCLFFKEMRSSMLLRRPAKALGFWWLRWNSLNLVVGFLLMTFELESLEETFLSASYSPGKLNLSFLVITNGFLLRLMAFYMSLDKFSSLDRDMRPLSLLWTRFSCVIESVKSED